MQNYNSKIKIFLFVSYLIGLTILGLSVILSGFNFQFNSDEIYNANTVYLMLKGYKPYTDFYTVYTPILHWVLAPVFLMGGFNFEAIAIARAVMILFFFLRLTLSYLLIAKIFNKWVGLIFIPLYLLSPFVVFTEMQIRPDNLAMLIYIALLLAFSYKRYFLSGVLFALTFLTSLKIVPSLVGLGLVFIYSVLQKRKLSALGGLINGSCLTFLVFLAFFLISGNATEMFQQVFIDAVRLNNAIAHPTWLGYFYFSNPTIYGLEGKPMNWIYTWMLPVLAFAGGYATIIQNSPLRSSSFEGQAKFKIQNENNQALVPIILFLSLFLQWFSLLFVNSVFIQYYIPLNWLYALFTAYFIYHLVVQSSGKARKLILIIVLSFFIFLCKDSLLANINRSKKIDDPIVKELTDFWKIVPEGKAVFPNVPFRPLLYPVLWGNTNAAYVMKKYPPVYKTIEKHKLPLLIGLHDELFSFLDYESQQYVQKNYQKDPADSRIWRIK